jgi:hypothetical protein
MRQSIRSLCNHVAISAVALVALTASAAQAGVPTAEADREWSLEDCAFGKCSIKYVQGLKNGFIGKYLKYQNRSYGINLGWDDNRRAVVRMGPARDHRDRDLRYGDAVNIYVESGGNVVYGSREWGINLVWTNFPRNDWRVTGGPAGTPVRSGNKFGLLNLTNNQRLVYCERPYGINLRWANDCNRGGSTSGPMTFTAWMQKQSILQGYIPYLGTFPALPANPAVRVTKMNFPTQWPAMLMLKPGKSTSDCGNPTAVVRVLGVMTAQQMKDAFGSETINVPFGQQFRFVGCIQDSGQPIIPARPVEITYQPLP